MNVTEFEQNSISTVLITLKKLELKIPFIFFIPILFLHVCSVFWLKKVKKRINRLLMSMSISDLIVIISDLIIKIIKLRNRGQIKVDFLNIMNAIANITKSTSTAISLLTMAVIAFNRYRGLMGTFSENVKRTKKLPLWAVFMLIWSICSSTFIVQHILKLNLQTKLLYFPVNLALIYLPNIFVSFFYGRITWMLHKRIIPGEATEDQRHHDLRQKRRQMRMLIALCISLNLLWLPYTICENIYFYFDLDPVYLILYKVLKILAYFRFTLNPIIYLIFKADFKIYVLSLFTNLFKFLKNVLLCKNY